MSSSCIRSAIMGRELPHARSWAMHQQDARLISVGYLGLTPERTDISGLRCGVARLASLFSVGGPSQGPAGNHRSRPSCPALSELGGARGARTQSDRADIARRRLLSGWTDSPWIEERTLERYELLYEAGFAQEASRGSRAASPPRVPPAALGEPMISDHRRILATAIGRLRGKIKYRPVVFELMPDQASRCWTCRRWWRRSLASRCTSRTSGAPWTAPNSWWV